MIYFNFHNRLYLSSVTPLAKCTCHGCVINIGASWLDYAARKNDAQLALPLLYFQTASIIKRTLFCFGLRYTYSIIYIRSYISCINIFKFCLSIRMVTYFFSSTKIYISAGVFYRKSDPHGANFFVWNTT